MIEAANDNRYAQTKGYRSRRGGYLATIQRLIVPIGEIEPIPYVLNAGPAAGGVYLLFEHATIVYVGRSGLIRDRLAEHWKRDRLFDSYASILCGSAHADALELHYIRAARPRGNVMNNRHYWNAST